MEKRYGLDLLLTINPDVEIYIEKILDRVDGKRLEDLFTLARSHSFTDWLVEGVIKNIVIVIMSQDSGEVIERWVFDTHMNEPIPQYVDRQTSFIRERLNAHSLKASSSHRRS
jgi:hypothetical protein